MLIDETNVIELLEAAAEKYGKGDGTYKDRVAHFFPDGKDTVTDEMARRELFGAMLERDAPRCIYTFKDPNNGKVPACLVGGVLIDAGLRPEWFEETTTNFQAIHRVLSDRGGDLGEVQVNEAAQVALEAAQNAQDNDRTWPQAIAAAKGELENFLKRRKVDVNA